MIVWAILLFAGGMILVIAECLLPGGLCGVLGAIFLVVSCVLGCTAYSDYALFIIIGEVIAAVVAFVVGVNLLPKTPMGRALVLNQSQDASAGWVATESDTSLMGAVGEVLAALRPAGTILVDGKRVDAVSNGQFIDKGAAVRVVEVHGSRVVVESTGPEME